ncbi:MAG TPA: histidine kinase [Usitatibacter sp.]|nr:histidine kinase [Usitatibacter sp.]
MLRSLVIVNLLVAAAATVRAPSLAAAALEFVLLAALAEPVLIVSLVALCGARRWLHAMGYIRSIVAVAVFELALSWAAGRAVGSLFVDYANASFPRLAALVLFATAVTLAYFDLRSRALAPAIADARIQALQARIRPHFLYNSINAVISLIRSEPRRAERALEDMADLFRVLMSENRTLAPIAEEVELARQYLAIESLRLGERLRVSWRIDGMPGDALVPPLVLQPLVENAVYHGIEPSPEGGEVSIDVRRDGPQLVMTLVNPAPAGTRSPAGNRMAIANIRERLQLHFDAEASMKSEVDEGSYRVTIRMPYLTAPA